MPLEPIDLPDTRGAERPQTRRPPGARTVQLYAADWSSFVEWCRGQDLAPLPAEPTTVAFYLRASAGRLGHGALARRAAAISDRHRQLGVPTPTSDPSVKTILAEARAHAAPRRKPPPSPKGLARMVAACPRDLAGTRDRAVLLLLETGKIRREALVGLDVEHVRFDASGAWLDVNDVALRVVRRLEIGQCPVRALQDWLDTSDTRFGPVFRKIDRWGNVEIRRLGADAVRRILARRTPRRARHKAQQPEALA